MKKIVGSKENERREGDGTSEILKIHIVKMEIKIKRLNSSLSGYPTKKYKQCLPLEGFT